MSRILPHLDEVQLHPPRWRAIRVSPCRRAGAARRVLPSGRTELRRLFFRRRISTFNTNINGTHYLLAALKQSRRTAVLFRRNERNVEWQRWLRRARRPAFTALQLRDQQSCGFDLTRNYREAYGCTRAAASYLITNRHAAVTSSYAEDYLRDCRILAGAARVAARQPGGQARLGPRPRIRRGHVAHAPAARGGTTT